MERKTVLFDLLRFFSLEKNLKTTLSKPNINKIGKISSIEMMIPIFP